LREREREFMRSLTPRPAGRRLTIDAGATSGIGAETARVLARRGVRLVLPARSLKAAAEARARVVAECPSADVIVLPLDLSSLASVRRFVARFLELGLPLNLLMYVLYCTINYFLWLTIHICMYVY
jgi:NAD(P)-dependent dehydrogenase (short-subunit alcohol dehydrogenase family)